MTFKNALLMSAAALINSSVVLSANAADVVLVEPEPVEFVRVCDVYGEGYFYIPGSETCLKFSGYIQVDYESRRPHDGWSTARPTSRHGWTYETSLAIEAQNETEWGTLRSELVFIAEGGDDTDDVFSGSNEGPGDAQNVIDMALISLAGFTVGFGDTFWQRSGDDGYYNAIHDGIYGEGKTTMLEYTYAADGFIFTAGVQSKAAFDNDQASGLPGQPDVYAGLDYSGDWGKVYGVYYHDSSQSAGAWKAGFEFDLSSALPGAAVKGWYMADNGDTDLVKGHTWGVSAQMEMTENTVLYAGYTDHDWEQNNVAWSPAADLSVTDFSVGVLWSVTDGLEVLAEYNKSNFDYQIVNDRVSTDSFSLRVVRSF